MNVVQDRHNDSGDTIPVSSRIFTLVMYCLALLGMQHTPAVSKWASCRVSKPSPAFDAQTATRSLWTTLVCPLLPCAMWLPSSLSGYVSRYCHCWPWAWLNDPWRSMPRWSFIEQWSAFAVNWFTNRSEMILETPKRWNRKGPTVRTNSSALPTLLWTCRFCVVLYYGVGNSDRDIGHKEALLRLTVRYPVRYLAKCRKCFKRCFCNSYLYLPLCYTGMGSRLVNPNRYSLQNLHKCAELSARC